MEEKLKEFYSLGKENFACGLYEDALLYFSEFIKGNTRFADVYHMLGVIYHQRGEFEEAVKAFKRALKLNPSYTEAYLNLAVTYSDLGKFKQAEEVYAQAAAATQMQAKFGIKDKFARGKLANMHVEIGDIYKGLGLHDEAIEEYRKALKLNPSFVDVKTKLGVAYRDKGDTKQAIKELKEAKRLKPGYSVAGINLGITYYSQGKIKEAKREWKDVLKRDSKNETARMYLRLVEEKK